MGNELLFRRLRFVNIGRVVSLLGILTVLSLLYLFANPYGNYLSSLMYTNLGVVSVRRVPHNSESMGSDLIYNHIDDAPSSHDFSPIDPEFDVGWRNLSRVSDTSAKIEPYRHPVNLSSGKEYAARSCISDASGCDRKMINGDRVDYAPPDHELSSGKSVLSTATGKSILSTAANSSLKFGDVFMFKDGDLKRDVFTRKRKVKAVSVVEMNSLLLNNRIGLKLKRSQLSSQRDRELRAAKFQIENAPMQRDISEVHSSLFWNYSVFKRSYELMETTLKVFVYREGEKPIFHMPYMRGIYASEGWFMKLMERNRQFVVKDPKRAHLFYLPFSSVKLRNALNGSSFATQKDLENHLKNYVDKIATKYRLWNRRGGADHFLVACHDWAPRLTRTVFRNTTRVLCNSNLARGFQIGKDVSLPVTYIRSSENPTRDIGGNPPKNRSILAFFAGGMHGSVRPLLLHHWHNKEPDMKILGPMSRDVEGKTRYREYMKSSKYCICAKGYEVHTPRVVESIYYECVPVIVSDNYVPPFFEIFDWESFAVFVLEDDIEKLRDILLGISEERYARMQRRVRMVQQYFVWHKVPERYDLFHMILHSVWFNRVFGASG